MKKFLGLIVTLALLINLNLVSVDAAQISSVENITADVAGTVVLQAKTKDFPSDLETLFAGRGTAITLGKKGKKIKVKGTYNGGTRVLVNEDVDLGDSVAQYSFDLPVLHSVMRNFIKKAKLRNRSMAAIFKNKVDALEGELSPQPGTPSTDSILQTFATEVNVNKTLSITKAIASRKGNKAKYKGVFNKGNSAKGRFLLKFTFE